MNYWPAEVTNLAECHEPLFDLIEELREPGRRTAQAHYGARGWVAHHNTDLWRVTTPGGRRALGAVADWAAPGSATHLWEHYAFSGDRAFLRRAYPVMKEAVGVPARLPGRGRATGRLVTNPSHSPENVVPRREGQRGRRSAWAPRWTSGSSASCSRDCHRGRASPGRGRGVPRTARSARSTGCRRTRSASTGSSRSGCEDFDEAEPGHRHVSHLFALHPGDQITPRGTPELAAAARVSLERRLAHGGGGPAGAAPGRSTSGRGSATATRRYENLRRCSLAHSRTAAQSVRRPPAVPDRRQLRRHRRHRGDAAAEPRGRARPAAGAAERPGRTGSVTRPARARRLRGRPRVEGEAPSSARSSARSAASDARSGTARGPCDLETRAGGTITLDGTLRAR